MTILAVDLHPTSWPVKTSPGWSPDERAAYEAWLANPENKKRMEERKAARLAEALAEKTPATSFREAVDGLFQEAAERQRAKQGNAFLKGCATLNAKKSAAKLAKLAEWKAEFEAAPSIDTLVKMTTRHHVTEAHLRDCLREAGCVLPRRKPSGKAHNAALDTEIVAYRQTHSIDETRAHFGLGQKRIEEAMKRCKKAPDLRGAA